MSSQRQVELNSCRSRVPDIQNGHYPFSDLADKLSEDDLCWLLQTEQGGPVNWNDEDQRDRKGVDLRGADLSGRDLRGFPLACIRGGLTGSEWENESQTQREKAAI